MQETWTLLDFVIVFEYIDVNSKITYLKGFQFLFSFSRKE